VAVSDLSVSRVARLAARMGNLPESEAASLFQRKRVLIAAESSDRNSIDTLVLATNLILRFCDAVSVALPPRMPAETLRLMRSLPARIRASAGALDLGNVDHADDADAIVMIGQEVRDRPGWVTVSSDGWTARTASWIDGGGALPHHPGRYNPIGADIAAALAAGRVFLGFLGREPAQAYEFSAHELAEGPIGSFNTGPPIPRVVPELDAFLIGCGSVMQGWTWTSRRLPIRGRACAVDPQFLAPENLGPYVLGWQSDVGKRKVDIVAAALGPNIEVTPDRDFVEFFDLRLTAGLAVPPIVIAGLDDISARHVVQRWWPDHMIDMATDGMTSQVIATAVADDGICLIEALPLDPASPSALARRAALAGLRIDRVLADPTGTIGDTDIAAADGRVRDALRGARADGQARCSRILAQELDDTADPSFAPAAPFIASFTGAVAAGLTLRTLIGQGESLHLQRSFESERARLLDMRSGSGCECRRL
jgi:hypothetical protein